MFFPSRSHPGPDRFYRLRAALFLVGTIAVLLGAGLELRWLVWSGMGVLAVAIAIRLLAHRQRDAEPAEDGAADRPGAEDPDI